ncbi:TRAP transporter small permease [Haliangium sp.]|uniref:TRAP transporter small permease n=1 Tax=Haliangium sp. TaxID=2663208 RepID=UPI003D141781
MTPLFATLERALVAANRAVIAALMMAMFGLVFTNVVTRYGLGISIAWAEEVARYLMIWTTFLGAGLALREGRHVAVDLLLDRLPRAATTWIRRAIAALMLAFLAALTYLGAQFVGFGWAQESPVTQIPMGVPYLAIPLGALLFAVHLVFLLRAFVARDFFPGDDEPDAALARTGSLGVTEAE